MCEKKCDSCIQRQKTGRRGSPEKRVPTDGGGRRKPPEHLWVAGGDPEEGGCCNQKTPEKK